MANLIGKKFNRLLVLEKTSQRENGSILWKCLCDCGNECLASTRGLNSGNKKSCGCLNNDRRVERFKKYNDENREDIIGKKYGKLTVIEITNKTSEYGTNLYYKCLCDCGEETYVTGNNLKGNSVQSCGKCSYINLIGERFGKLVVIEKVEDKIRNNGKHLINWKCNCDCGNVTYGTTDLLRRGEKQSCGCLTSKGEAKIIQILQKENVPYTYQKTYEDLSSYNNIKYRFDFEIEGKIIEYDGEQHFGFKNTGWNTEKNYLRTKNNDMLKNQYCLTNNIPLYRIPYWEFNNINTVEDLFQEKFLIKE